jgi:hypothetical protein
MVDPVRNNPGAFNHSQDYLFGKAAGEVAGGFLVAHLGFGPAYGGAALILSGEGSMHGLGLVGIGGVMTVGGGVNAVNGLQDLVLLLKAGGSGTSSAPTNVHGNSADSPNAQHGYEIRDTKTGEIVKVGISGGKRTADGGSVRANAQVNQWNRETGEPGRFKAEVVKEIPAGPGARRDALKWEKARADQLKADGQLKFEDKHKKP